MIVPAGRGMGWVQTDNEEGQGVCLNNMGGLCRAMTARNIHYSRTLETPQRTLIIKTPSNAAWLFDKVLPAASAPSRRPSCPPTVQYRS